MFYESLLAEREAALAREQKEGFLSEKEAVEKKKLFAQIRKFSPGSEQAAQGAKECFLAAKCGFDEKQMALETAETEASEALEAAFDFMEQAFSDGQELVVFVTELTMGSASAEFLAEHTSERYLNYNRELMIGSRRAELLKKLQR